MLSAFKEGRGVYGFRRVHRALLATGFSCTRKEVARAMKAQGLIARPRRRWKAQAKAKGVLEPVAAQRIFKVGEPSAVPRRPSLVLVGDITQLRIQGQVYHLAAVMDVFHRAVVGWEVSSCASSGLVITALQHAVRKQQFRGPVVFHSDRGTQYTSLAFQQAAKACGVRLSMSRKGNCYDNAYIESFFKTLKSEDWWRRSFCDRADLRNGLFEYIEWYNRSRLHSALNYSTPNQFLQAWIQKNNAHP